MVVLIDPVLYAMLEDAPVSRRTVEAAVSIVSTIYEHCNDRVSSRLARQDKHWNQFVRLHSDILGQVYGDVIYRRALTLLTEFYAIEIDGDYLSATIAIERGLNPDQAYSRGYRLTPKFRNVVEIEMAAPELEARLEEVLKIASYAVMGGRARKWLINSYKRTSFTDAAEDVLDKMTFADDDARKRASGAYRRTRDHSIRFTAGRKKSGRVFYPVTSLPAALRPCLLLDKQPTVELDIAACQPSLLATLYPPDSPERAAYLDFVRRPDFYEQFARWAGQTWTRDECKREVFNQVIYGSAFCEDDYPLLPPFVQRFPQLAHLMREIKLGPGSNSALPLQMQGLESLIVIDGAVGECASREIPVLSVHDSLICRLADGPTVAEVLGKHWVAKTGMPARVKGLQMDVTTTL